MLNSPADILAAGGSGVEQFIGIVIVITIMVVQWLFKKVLSSKDDAATADEAEASDAEQEKRLQRIREEVARRQAATQTAAYSEPPAIEPQTPLAPPPPINASWEISDASSTQKIVDDLDDARQSLARTRQTAQDILRGVHITPAPFLVEATATAPTAASRICALLRDRESVRTAIVMREVLSPPLSLRH
ncbi:MAG: hypothetical protein LBV54_05015 [Puniceicoccales bacterium]|jgi:hypothetical protein|nr:hypothetical protein [Puniceicoccales bacterium]